MKIVPKMVSNCLHAFTTPVQCPDEMRQGHLLRLIGTSYFTAQVQVEGRKGWLLTFLQTRGKRWALKYYTTNNIVT